MTSPPPALEVASVGVRAGRRWIVRDVTFTARGGEIIAVIGPNGAGKTTLLEAIVGLRRTAAGTVRAAGRPLSRFADFARTFSFLPEGSTLPPETSVGTLVARATFLAPRDRSMHALVAGFGIESLRARPVGVLSRGEQQRVALFCTLVLGRPLAVLDEPFAAFDPLQLRAVLTTLRETVGTTTAVIASIHQLADAARVADRILILASGASLAYGDLAALRARVGKASASLEEIFVALLEEPQHAP